MEIKDGSNPSKIYEEDLIYKSAALEAEATRISPDGSSVGTTMVMWVGSPHFFRTESLIALYVGESPTVIEALAKVMGPQFAGR